MHGPYHVVEHDALNSTAGFLGRAKRIVQNKFNKHTPSGNTREFPVEFAMFQDIHFDPGTEEGGSKVIRGIYKHTPIAPPANTTDKAVVTTVEDPCYFEVKITCMRSGQETASEYNRGKHLKSITIPTPGANDKDVPLVHDATDYTVVAK